MLIALFTWSAILFVSFCVGSALLLIVKGKDQKPTMDFSKLIILGFALITSLATIWSFFYRIDAGFLFAITAIGLVSLFLNFRNGNLKSISATFDSTSGKFVALLFCYILLLAYFSTIAHPVGDHGLYYTQTIKWLNEFGTVKGLGNLHTRLAFNSSWHTLSAVFNGGLFFEGSYYDMNLVLVIIMLATSVSGYLSVVHHNNHSLQNWLKLSIIPILILYYVGIYWYKENLFDIPFIVFVTQPSPDLVVSLLLVVCLIAYLDYSEDQSSKTKLYYFVILTCYTFTVKLSASPCILLIGYAFYREKTLYRDKLLLGSILFVLAPYIIRNVLLSGYLLFPFSELDLFGFDWEVPKQSVQTTACWIKSWAKLPGRDCIEVNNLKFGEWIYTWYNSSYWYDKVLLWVSVIFFPLYALRALVKSIKSESVAITDEEIVFTIVFIGNIMWFFQAPDFRFGYGFLTLSFILVLWKISAEKSLQTIFRGFFLIFVLVNYKLATDLSNQISDTKGKVNMFVSSEKEYVPKLKKENKNGVDINYVESGEYDACWESALPCTPEMADITLRENTLKEGFKSIK